MKYCCLPRRLARAREAFDSPCLFFQAPRVVLPLAPGGTAYLQNNTAGLLYSMLLNGPVGDKYGFSIAKYVGKRSSCLFHMLRSRQVVVSYDLISPKKDQNLKI